MASVLAEGVVKKVGQIAVQQVLNEVSIVSNFTEEFHLLKERIEEINCGLNEADEESSRQQESAKIWLHRVRDIAWEAEDILEECAVDSLYATNPQFCSLNCSQLILRHQMGRRIQKVKTKLISVIADGNQLNILRVAVPHKEETESSSTPRVKRSSLPPRDSKPVGMESKIESMVRLLENPQIPTIAVVGMGGMGKTYLLQHVYDSTKGRYEKSAWLSVSQFYSVSKLQRGLAFQLDENFSEKINKAGIDEEVAAQSIHDFMQGKRCLIVLDDIWRATRENDLLTKLGIPSGDDGQCKILVSTRSKEVAVNLRAEIYEMKYLTDEESWRLFCVHAFSGFEGNKAPQHLEELARNIIKECGNLPLATKTTAASLASTTLPKDWHSMLSKLKKVGTSNDPVMNVLKLKKVGTSNDPVMNVLKLSYDSLPAHLKACFAYFSFFPEDEKIDCEYLMYLWMGEGFIPVGEDPWNCLDQLANLCLLEVCEYKSLDKYCKIHDLLLDLAILISRENKCAFSLEDAFPKLHSVNTGGVRWCRLFLPKKDIDEHAISERRPVFPTLVRTLSLSWNDQIGRNIPAMLFNGMSVLRVLDLSYTNISTLPASVGGMKLLKVLNLTMTEIRKVPKCVRSLKSLYYLNVYGCPVRKAPKWIGELRCLQYLAGQFDQLPKGISKLESLRTLRTYLSFPCKTTCMQCGVLRIEDVGKMSELQEIRFGVYDETELKKMEEGILAPLNKMRRLQVENGISRRMQGESESDLPQFPESMSAMRDLEHLKLFQFAVPSWIGGLTNLRLLYLQHCDCSDLPELQALPSLERLGLFASERRCKVPKAFGKSGGFPHLRFFSIGLLDELEEFPEMEDGAMPCLEKLHITLCKKLNKVGEGLERLKSLRELCFYGSGTRELRAMFEEGGEYSKKVKDINPQITIIM